MPDPTTLVGKRIEMVMKFEIPSPAGLVEKFYWCPGTVLFAVKDKTKHKVGRKTYTFGWAEVEWDGVERKEMRT